VPVSRAFDHLCLLVSRPGEVVTEGELVVRAWPNVNIEETTLRFQIAQLRRGLGDSQDGERYVVNVPGRGYCFVACVSREALPLKHGHVNSTTGLLDWNSKMANEYEYDVPATVSSDNLDGRRSN
jgi:DNA-binding winged helix-turn-helix (wHTH) protein